MKGWLDKYADGGEIRNPKTGEVIPLTGEGRPMLSSDDRNVFQRVGDRIYNEYEEHKPQLFKDFPITDLPGAVVSYITGHSDPEAGLSMVVPAGKVTPITRTVSRGRTSSSLSPFLTNEKGELRFLTAEEWQNAIRQGVKNVRGYLQDPRYKEVVERNQALAKRVKIEQSPLPIERKHNLPLYESRVAQSSESLGINDPRKLELENIQGKTKEVSQYTRDLGGSGSLTIPRIFPANATIKNTEHEMLHHVYPNLGEGYPSFTELENLKLLKTFKSPTELRQIEEATGITPWYLDDADELLPNSFDLATEIGINKFQAYPGKNSFKQMLDNYAGGKTFMRDALKLNTNRDYKRAWDLLTGVRLSAIPASIAIGSQIGDNETKNFQDGGKIENRFDIARRDVTNISPLEPPAVSETYNIPDYDRDAYFSLSAADKRNALREKLSGIAFYDPFVSTVNPRDKSRVITFGEDKPELKYLRNAKFTQKAKEDVAKFAAKRNIDPNVLLSSMAIESPVLNASKYFNTHNLGMKMLERAGFPTKFKLSKDSMELPLEDLAMNAGAYMEDKSINYKKLDEKIEKWLPIANSIDSTLRTIESPMDAHALFLSEFGIDSVNPKQQVLPGVKESYSTMVKRGADYIRSRKIFEDGGNVQMKNQLVNLDQLTDFSNNNKKMQTGGVVENEREEYLRQQYQNYLHSQAEKGREAVTKGGYDFAKDYVIPAIKTAGSFTPAGPIIGLTDAYDAYKHGNTGWAIAGAAAETLPYVGKTISKGLSSIPSTYRRIVEAARKNDFTSLNPFASKLNPNMGYAPISMEKAKRIIDTGLIYRGTESGKAVHYLPIIDESGNVKQYIPKYEKDIYGKRKIGDDEIVTVTFPRGKRIKVPASQVKSGKFSKSKNLKFSIGDQEFVNITDKTTVSTIPYSGKSSPDIKFKIGEIPDYTLFGINKDFILQADPARMALVKGPYKRVGSDKAGFPFAPNISQSLKLGDWGIPLTSITRGEYSTLGAGNRMLVRDPIWGYREIVDPDRLVTPSDKLANIILKSDKTIKNIESLLKPIGRGHVPEFINERMRMFGMNNPWLDANENVPTGVFFLHPVPNNRYNNLRGLMSRNRYPYLYKKPLSHPEWRRLYDDLPEEYFNTADMNSVIPPSKRQALLLEQYTHEFSPMLNYDQQVLLDAGLSNRELKSINKQIIKGISRNKLQPMKLQHLTGNILSDKLKASELVLGQEFELNRPLSTSYGEYGIKDKSNIIVAGGKYNFHINTGNKSRGIFLDAKGMPGAYISAEKEVLIPPSKFKVTKIEGNDIYLDLTKNLKYEKGGIIPNIQKPNKLSNFTSGWLDKYE